MFLGPDSIGLTDRTRRPRHWSIQKEEIQEDLGLDQRTVPASCKPSFEAPSPPKKNVTQIAGGWGGGG